MVTTQRKKTLLMPHAYLYLLALKTIIYCLPKIFFPQVANTNVRNIGSIAGNLMLKHTHQDFPSDIFLLLEALNADVAIRSTNGSVQTVKPEQFLATEMDKKIIFYVLMPQYGDNYKFWYVYT